MPAPPIHRRRLLQCGLLAPLGWTVPALALPLPAPDPPTPARPALRIGPGQAFTRVADALRRAQDGDTLELLPGTYAGDVAVITQRRLRIVGLGRATGDQPQIVADGRDADGKAIWVVQDGDIRIENIGFRGARVRDGNGAGIRFQKGRLRLRHCRFVDNQMGLLSGNDASSELEIVGCEFAEAPLNPGSLPHLLYVGRIARFSLHASLLRQGRTGHLLKSRAREATLVGNRIDDGHSGEASYEVDLPNGGIALLQGNTIVQSPLAQNSVMVSYGAEGAPWDRNQLTLVDNTLVNRREAGGWFVRVWDERLPAGTPVLSRHNRLLGPGEMQLGPAGSAEGDERGPVPGG